MRKLYEGYYDNGKNQRGFYIEGIGTENYEKDDIFEGTAFGCGSNGMRGKVFKACKKMVSACDKQIKYINIDVFGFSRGAAAARNLVYEVMREEAVPTILGKWIVAAEPDKIAYSPFKSKTNKRGFLGFCSINRVLV